MRLLSGKPKSGCVSMMVTCIPIQPPLYASVVKAVLLCESMTDTSVSMPTVGTSLLGSGLVGR